MRIGLHSGVVVAGEMGTGDMSPQHEIVGEMPHIAIFLIRHCLARGRRQQGPHSGHRSLTSFADPLVGITLPSLEDPCVASAETGSDSLAGDRARQSPGPIVPAACPIERSGAGTHGHS